jgi:LysR family D-serine deaminase transcriptional activator
MQRDEHPGVRSKLLSSHQLARLHTFEAAARHGSFALAADELSLSPSAVSHRISALEEALGFLLFQRFHRKVALTTEGQRIFWALTSSLEFINQEVLEIREQALSGSLTLHSRPSIAQCWLVPRLADFSRLYPHIELNLLTGNEHINLHGKTEASRRYVAANLELWREAGEEMATLQGVFSGTLRVGATPDGETHFRAGRCLRERTPGR